MLFLLWFFNAYSQVIFKEANKVLYHPATATRTFGDISKGSVVNTENTRIKLMVLVSALNTFKHSFRLLALPFPGKD
jgi:hypothetical protein